MRSQVALRQGLVDGFSDTDSVITVFSWHPLCQAFPLAHYDLSRVMIRYWTNFAATGDPNGSGLPECPACGPNGHDTCCSADATIHRIVCRMPGQVDEYSIV